MELDAFRQSGGHLSMPAAAHTVTGVASAAAKKSKTGLVAFGIIGAILVAGGAAALFVVAKSGQTNNSPAPVAQAPTSTAQDTSTAQPAAASLTRGEILVETDPPGATLFVNGEKQSDTRLRRLPIGTPIELKATKDGYADAVQTVTLTDDQPNNIVKLTLKHGTFSLEVTLKQHLPGASLLVDGKPAGMQVDGLSAGEAHRVIVFAPGYNPQQLSVTGNAHDKKTLDAWLTKADPTKPKDPTVPTAPPATSTIAAAPAGGPGRLSVGARGGWCNVVVDGQARGPTPVVISVPAGNHSVSCTTEGGKTFGATVNVPPDGKAGTAFTIPAP